MGSYKLYLAVIAVASIAAVQETSCADEPAKQYDKQNEERQIVVESEEEYEPEIESTEVPESVNVEHHQCEEYKSKIWNNAFSNDMAMEMMKLTFETAEKMASDEVCSDSIRALFNFIEVITTNQNTYYTLRMFKKMMSFIARELNVMTYRYRNTAKVFEGIVNNPAIRNYVKDTVTQTVDLLREPEIRGRLFRIITAFANLMKPSENEKNVQPRLNALAPTSLAKNAMNRFGNIFRRRR